MTQTDEQPTDYALMFWLILAVIAMGSLCAWWLSAAG